MVLEYGIRQLADAAGVKKPAGDLSGLSSQLLQTEAIDPLRKNEHQVWTDFRNAADHADWDAVTEERTTDMLRSVARWLADAMRKP